MSDVQGEANGTRHPAAGRLAGWRPWWLLAAGGVALVMAGLWLFAGLSPGAAFTGFVLIAAGGALARHVAGRAARGNGDGDAAAQPIAGDADAALAARLHDPCFLIDRQTRVRYQNPVATRTFGRLPPGRPLSLMLRAPEIGEAIQQTVDTGLETTVTYFERVPADRWFEARVAWLRDADGTEGTAGLLMVLLRDLTQAQRVERMRADFVANASHELRTPLASLIGFIETLQGTARDDPAARERFLGIMAEQALRMSRLIDDLLSLSRIELKAHVRPEDEVDLARVLRHVVDAMQPLARESGIDLHLDLADRPTLVRGDKDELAQVFQNLVHNALKYGHSGKRVDISATRRGRGADRPDQLSVTVRDYGPGIAPEHLPRLTERFYRIDAVYSREKGGTGLGLAIVKHILNRHSGHLAIASEPGQGASFTVVLDALPGAVAAVAPRGDAS